MVAVRAAAKGLELVSVIEHELPRRLRGDRFRLRQVLINLASNAIKFTEHGEIVIRAKPHTESDGRAMIRFEVSDTGIGLSPEQTAGIFDAFSQADISTTRKYGGTGLGLAISRRLITIMGGTIGVDSEPDVGSTFRVTVPLNEALTPAAQRTDLRGLRVLAVDDNDVNREILHEHVIGWGMRNGCAASGPEALERLRAAAADGAGYDVAILDMQMPMMSGLELAYAIKADPAIAAVRLIILSSIGDHGLATESRAAGVDACLTKPTRHSELYDCLARVMAPGSHPEFSRTDTSTAAVARPHNGARILVAEDSLVNQAVARGLLVSLGYTVDMVDNGLEAIEATERTAYHAILMDCQMPKMDGYEAVRTIRAREGGRARVPIIALTADVLADARTKSLAAGMDDYLTKPITAEALAAVLDRLVPIVTNESAAPPRDGDSGGPLDRAVLGQLHKLEATTPGLMDNVIGLFLNEMPSRLNDLRDAMLEADLRKMARLAHAMKGSAANLGARSLAALCSDVEEQANAGSPTASGADLDDLEREFGRVREALQAKAWVA